MTAVARLALVGLARAPARTAIRVLTLAAAAALLGAMILFVGHSLRTMSAGATRSVPLDWQGPVSSHRAALRTAAGIARQPGVLEAKPVATAPFAGVEHRAAAGSIRAGAGSILAVPPGYLDHIRTFRFLRGSLKAGEIVLDQQLAATLQAQPGDTLLLTPRRNARPEHFRVSGIALVTAPDTLFQPLNPLLGPAPSQPPANIAIVPLDTFARRLGPHLPVVASGAAAASLPGTQSGVQWQIQAQVDPSAVLGSPAHALTLAGRIRNRAERSLPGQVQFVDNLSDALTTATGDALYAETLYIMLALPGALIALGLAYLAALGTVERDRRELALLRARGASRRHLLVLALVESAVIGVVAGAIGSTAALLAVRATVSGAGIGASRLLATVGICSAIGVAGAAAARIGAAGAALHRGVVEGRRSGTGRKGRPLWQRLFLDVLALAVSGLVYWLTLRTGFSAVVNPDSNPTLSLSVYMFFAPALLWLGATLLLVRLRGRVLGWGAARLSGGRAASGPSFLLVSASRRGDALNRGLVVVGLLLAFGVSLGIFTATYDTQARIDAQLTLGADVVATAAPGTIARDRLAARVAALAGVAGTTAVDHTYAYVGPDLQDTFGIDAASFTRGTTLRDSYFLGGTARQILARLRATPDGVLVSKETISDYSLSLGDLLKLRLRDRTSGRFRIVPFHVAGVVQEFPAAPRDSFMVANRSYLERATHDPGPNVLFVKATGDAAGLARRVEASTGSSGTTVKGIRAQTAQTASSITAVDLRGISRIEAAFTVLLAAAAMLLFVGVALAERRQELATMAALGAPLRRVAAFIWSEAALVLSGCLALAAVLGWLVAEMLVAMLRHVFDPPPDQLSVPWGYLAILGGAAVVGTLVACAAATLGIRRLPLGAILREE